MRSNKYIHRFLEIKKNKMSIYSMQNKIIAVAFGGNRSESDVSRTMASEILLALNNHQYKTFPLEMQKHHLIEEFENLIVSSFKEKRFDILLNAMPGFFGEDGQLSLLCEKNNIPYTHSNFQSSNIAMDKLKTKQVMLENNILTAKHIALKKKDILNHSIGELIQQTELEQAEKLILKASCGGSSRDCFVIENKHKTFVASDFQESFEDFVLEEFISGREISVAILENEVLGAIEIVPKNAYFDYESKYSEEGAIHLKVNNVSANTLDLIYKNSLLLHNKIGLNNISRVDLILSKDSAYFLEINNVPGMTKLSLVPDVGKIYYNMQYIEIIEKILKNINA